MIHPIAWVCWLLASLVALSATRNPLYLTLVLLCITLVSTTVTPKAEVSPPISPLRFATIVVVFSALFNALTFHAGETVVFRLPESIPLLGGPITLEAMVYGGLNGLVLAGFFAAFVALNAALSTRELIGLVPRAFHPVAVVISIAITFVPTTFRQMQAIREAQAIRGHRVRGVRDWLPLFMPLLVGGLERALQLAEALTARGFAAGTQTQDTKTRVALVAGLATLLAGWLLRLVWGHDLFGLQVMLLGGVVVLGALWVLGRRTSRTTYRPHPWRPHDWSVVVTALIVIGSFVLPVPPFDQTTLRYAPYPALHLPAFDPLVGTMILGLLWPAVLLQRIEELRATPIATEVLRDHLS